ncbi:putative toxin biosynthesis protein [Xylariaceae sp. FL0662B]|nr:putative toxin biosynthesis protein [Xylariaceae sp. FL0662B]
MAFPFHVKEHTIPAQHVREWPRATARSQEDVLHLSVKQYIPVDNPDPQPGDVTIIGAHANGFPKELYEALWADLHRAAAAASSKPGGGFRIRGIWIADVASQGYSGTANEGLLGDDPSWHDHARDLLHLTNAFRGEMPRPLVGIGHSFGGAVLTELALMHPRLLAALVLLDATITPFTLSRVGPGKSPARASAFRRETWPSRAAAADSFRRSPFYRAWDPRVLDAWVAHALRETPTALFPAGGETAAGKEVTLRTTKHQEVFMYFRPLWPYIKPDGSVDRDGAPDWDPAFQDQLDAGNVYPFYRTEGATILQRLPAVRPSVLWVLGGESDLSTPEARKMNTELCGIGGGGSGGIKAGRVDQVVMEGMGHLFPMEVPKQCAKHAATWIEREMKRWRDQEREYEQWTKLSMQEKSTLSKKWLDLVGRPPPRKGSVEDTGSKL